MIASANEVFLSAVMNRPVINPSGRRIGQLHDMAIGMADRMPVVSHLLVKGPQGILPIPFSDVALFNPAIISLRSEDAGAVAPSTHDGEILIRRDILDKQIVDLDGAKLVRVNDLRLRMVDAALYLAAVDVGLRGILRRLGFLRAWDAVAKFFNRKLGQREIGWHLVQPLDMNLSRLTLTVTRDKLSDLHPADLADILSQLSHQHIPAILSNLDPEAASEAMSELEPEVSSNILSRLDSDQAADVLEEMNPDEAADVLAELPDDKARELLDHMDPEDAGKVLELLEHEEDTAGGLMNNEFLAITADMTAEQALRQVRASAADMESIAYSYVLDSDERLVGVVSLRELIVAEPAAAVEEFMEENVKSVPLDADPPEIYETIVRYNLAAVPVLDPDGRMEGIVTADDIMAHFLPFALRWKQFKAARFF